MVGTSNVAERLTDVRTRIAQAAGRAGRQADDVRLIAVSKTVPLDRIQLAVAAGVTDLGENRVQEAEAKIPELLAAPRPRWHLIGHLQSNKARRALELFDVIQSVDSLALAELLSRRLATRTAPGGTVEVLFEVNVAGEASKQGFAPDQLLDAAPALAVLPGLQPRGLMTVAPATQNPEEVRWVFQSLRQLRDRVVDRMRGVDMRELSMGMSHDFPIAVEEGATMVRIGSAVFGERQ